MPEHRSPPVFATAALCALGGAPCATVRAQETPAPDPAPRLRLVYDLSAYELGKVLDARPDVDLGQLVDETLKALAKRLGRRPTLRAIGGSQFAVEFDGSRRDAAAMRARVESGREFALCALAIDAAWNGAFDLDAEKWRLSRWLEQGGRDRVLARPTDIEAFNDERNAGQEAPVLRWIPHRVTPRLDDPEHWDLPLSRQDPVDGVVPLDPSVVAVFGHSDWNDGIVPLELRDPGAPRPFLLEFVAIDVSAGSLRTDDFRFWVQMSAKRWVLKFVLRGDEVERYREWGDHLDHRHYAIVLNGEVTTAPPAFKRPNPSGQLEGFPPDELKGLDAALNGPALPVTPVFVRMEPAR